MPTTNVTLEQSFGDVWIERDTLSDGSVAFNVCIDDPLVRFACISREHAQDLAAALKLVAWFEVNNGKVLR